LAPDFICGVIISIFTQTKHTSIKNYFIILPYTSWDSNIAERLFLLTDDEVKLKFKRLSQELDNLME
jgi:hypothetical protein